MGFAFLKSGNIRKGLKSSFGLWDEGHWCCISELMGEKIDERLWNDEQKNMDTRVDNSSETLGCEEKKEKQI
jgi:hypothetical protein